MLPEESNYLLDDKFQQFTRVENWKIEQEKLWNLDAFFADKNTVHNQKSKSYLFRYVVKSWLQLLCCLFVQVFVLTALWNLLILDGDLHVGFYVQVGGMVKLLMNNKMANIRNCKKQQSFR